MRLRVERSQGVGRRPKSAAPAAPSSKRCPQGLGAEFYGVEVGGGIYGSAEMGGEITTGADGTNYLSRQNSGGLMFRPQHEGDGTLLG